MDNKQDVIEIDLLELLHILWRKIAYILIVGVLCALLAYCGSQFLLTSYYDSTTKIYVLNKNDSNTLTYSDTQLATQLTKDYSHLITSRYVLEQVVQDLGLDISYENLNKKVTVTTPTDTRIVAITVRDSDPVLAMNICNLLRDAASEHIKNVMDIDAVNIVETANMPEKKAGPNNTKNAIIGGFIGVIFMAGMYIITYLLDDTIKTSDDVAKYLELSTLAMIPLEEGLNGEVNKKKKKKKRKKI